MAPSSAKHTPKMACGATSELQTVVQQADMDGGWRTGQQNRQRRKGSWGRCGRPLQESFDCRLLGAYKTLIGAYNHDMKGDSDCRYFVLVLQRTVVADPNVCVHIVSMINAGNISAAGILRKQHFLLALSLLPFFCAICSKFIFCACPHWRCF